MRIKGGTKPPSALVHPTSVHPEQAQRPRQPQRGITIALVEEESKRLADLIRRLVQPSAPGPLDSSSTKAMVMPRCGWRGRCACSGWTLVGWTRAEGGLVPPLMRMTAAPAWLALGPLSLRELAFRQGDQAA